MAKKPKEDELRKKLGITPEQLAAERRRDVQRKLDQQAAKAREMLQKDVEKKASMLGAIPNPGHGVATGSPLKNIGAHAGARAGVLKMSKVAAKSIKNVAKEDTDRADTIGKEESVIDKKGETRNDE